MTLTLDISHKTAVHHFHSQYSPSQTHVHHSPHRTGFSNPNPKLGENSGKSTPQHIITKQQNQSARSKIGSPILHRSNLSVHTQHCLFMFPSYNYLFHLLIIGSHLQSVQSINPQASIHYSSHRSLKHLHRSPACSISSDVHTKIPLQLGAMYGKESLLLACRAK
jgi:hypothetical protein